MPGTSKELGCLQFQQPTFYGYSMQTLGYMPPFTKINQEYVASREITIWLRQGATPSQIFLWWNAGKGQKKCSVGVNKYKTRYDSCSYVKKGISIINQFTAYAE